jgi:hypothetical protein
MYGRISTEVIFAFGWSGHGGYGHVFKHSHWSFD